MSDRRISVKKVKWLMPDALASIFDFGIRSSPAMRARPPANSWHRLTFRTEVAVFTARATRLSGLVRLIRKASGQYRSMSAQMPSMVRMDRSEWKTPPGPPFSPVIWVAPVPAGDLVVLDPVGPTPDLGTGQAEVGPGQGFRRIGGRLDGDGAVAALD